MFNKWNKFLKISKYLIRNKDYLVGSTYLNKHNLYSTVHHSAAIEGSILNFKESWELLENKLFPMDNSKQNSVSMLIDHYNALLYTIKKANERHPINLDLIKKINSILKKRTGFAGICPLTGNPYNTSSGEFRTYFMYVNQTDNSEKIFVKPSEISIQVDILLRDLAARLSDTNDIKSVNLLAFEAHYRLVNIHPFGDGNGRTSRLLMNYIQAYHSCPITIIQKKYRYAYYRALEETDRINEEKKGEKDYRIFYDFMLKASIKSMLLTRSSIHSIKRKSKKDSFIQNNKESTIK